MKKVLLLTIITIVTLFILGVSSFLYFKTTPQYTIYQLSKAYKSHDIVLAKTYIDIDGISDQIAEGVVNYAREQINKPSDDKVANKTEAYKLGEEIAKKWFNELLPTLREDTKKQINNAFVESIEGKPQKEDYYPPFQSIEIKDLFFGGKVKVQSSGAIKLLSVPSSSGKTLTFRMRNENGAWRIVKWENLDDIVKKIAEENAQQEQEKAESKTKYVKFNERISLSHSGFVTVTAPEDYIPKNTYDRAKEGNKFVAIEVLYENESDTDEGYDPSNFELKDKNDYRYKRSYSGKAPVLDWGTLPAYQKARGFITYEVPTDTEISEVLYTNSFGDIVIFSK